MPHIPSGPGHMKMERPGAAVLVSVAVACLGFGGVLYPFVTGYDASDRFGYYVLGGFVGFMGLVSAVIFNTRSRVRADLRSHPLLRWRNPPGGRDEGQPGEVVIAESGLLWDGELIPFAAWHCSLVDAWIDTAPVPSLTVVYTTRDRVGRKTHNLCTPVPAELLPQADAVVRRLVAKYRLEGAVLRRSKRRRR